MIKFRKYSYVLRMIRPFRRKLIEQLRDGSVEDGMSEFGRNFCQWREDESACVELRMRQVQARLIQDYWLARRFHQQQIQVERARAFRWRVAAIAAVAEFDGEHRLEEL